ncbi:MAG: hypothetical protein KBS95_02755 [Alistipes sp.]|nr:hypothetical protein [Candidatus Alistipes equi]
MGKYRVIAGQNLYDIALHIYGRIKGIVDLMMCNTNLSLDTTLKKRDPPNMVGYKKKSG